jgi:hypothetical protein
VAKSITFSLNGSESVFEITTLERSAVYGKKRRVALDSSGKPCSRVTVTSDGSTMLKSGMTGQAYFLPDGAIVKQSQLEIYDATGKPLEKYPSSLSTAQSLSGPVSPQQILDTKIDSIYVLEEVNLSSDLKTSLDNGDVYSLTFALRDSYEPSIGFIVANKNGYFLISGEPTETEWMELSTTVSLPVDDDVDSDDLDFEML